MRADEPFKSSDKNVRTLIDSVKLKEGSDQRLSKLLKHHLNNVVLVSDLDKAFELSAAHKNLTCITIKN